MPVPHPSSPPPLFPPRNSPSTTTLSSAPLQQNLPLRLQLLHHRQRNLQRIRDNLRRRERQPLRQADIGNAIALVEFDPAQFGGVGRVFNVVTCCGRIATIVVLAEIRLHQRTLWEERGGGDRND